MKYLTKKVIEKAKKRFEQKYEKKMGACWEWKCGKYASGHGQFWLNGISRMAHRAAWILYNGPISDDLCVCHKCDNPGCVNIDHLFLGTLSDNNLDAVKKGRNVKGELVGTHKLKTEEIIEIRKLYKTNKYTQAQLGEKYNVCEDNIYKIVNHHTWKHVLA